MLVTVFIKIDATLEESLPSNSSHTVRNSDQINHCPQIVATTILYAVYVGLFVLYDLFPQLTAAQRGCTYY